MILREAVTVLLPQTTLNQGVSPKCRYYFEITDKEASHPGLQSSSSCRRAQLSGGGKTFTAKLPRGAESYSCRPRLYIRFNKHHCGCQHSLLPYAKHRREDTAPQVASSLANPPGLSSSSDGFGTRKTQLLCTYW